MATELDVPYELSSIRYLLQHLYSRNCVLRVPIAVYRCIFKVRNRCNRSVSMLLCHGPDIWMLSGSVQYGIIHISHAYVQNSTAFISNSYNSTLAQNSGALGTCLRNIIAALSVVSDTFSTNRERRCFEITDSTDIVQQVCRSACLAPLPSPHHTILSTIYGTIDFGNAPAFLTFLLVVIPTLPRVFHSTLFSAD